MNDFWQQLGLTIPVIQAPMAGTSTPALAAAVSNAGGLGSIAIGAMNPGQADRAIGQLRTLTNRAINVNVFCHRPAAVDPAAEQAWIDRLAPVFRAFDATPPSALREIYKSFVADGVMQAMLLRHRPAVVSFHFGLPSAAVIDALHAVGSTLLATVTSPAEAELAAHAGVDALIAQGYEAGGHRGVFDENAGDDRLGTMPLVRLLVRQQSLPVIAAGGIMDGAGVAAALTLGASAAQMGTAFIACPESAADAAYRAALASDAARHTTMTRVISGRPARCLSNAFTRWGRAVADTDVCPYPIAYDAGKALNTAATAKGDSGYGAHWAGQGAPLARSLPAADLLRALNREMRTAQGAK